jgi:mRNA interferase RelE/StbE
MSYEIIFSDKAFKQLKKLEQKNQERIIKVLERIRIRPESFVTKIVGDPGFRLRVGEYRVIVDIEKEKLLILVIKIGHRSRIYKKM